jgi:hypothetical protein
MIPDFFYTRIRFRSGFELLLFGACLAVLATRMFLAGCRDRKERLRLMSMKEDLEMENEGLRTELREMNGTCRCGEPYEGDGYKTVLHCPNAHEDDYQYHEPDAQPVQCRVDESTPQPG